MINLSNIQQGNVSSNSDFDMTGSNSSSSSSSTFESSLLSRVLLVEEEAKRLRQQLAVANKEVSSLTAENDLLKKLSHDQTYMIHRSNELQSENKDLRKQIVEMEQFLDDYGKINDIYMYIIFLCLWSKCST